MPPNDHINDKKLFIKSYGCQMNVYDAERMAMQLAPLGFSKTTHPEEADMVILNTCHIREKADDKVFSDIGRLEKLMKRDSILTLAGCTAQSIGVEMQKQKPRIDIVVGTQNYHRLPQLLERRLSFKKRIADIEFPVESKFDYLKEELIMDNIPVSQFLTIQEGCDKFCSFCVVPYTRGAESSRPYDAIVKEAKQLTAKGAREITLLGQNVNGWHGRGQDGKEWNLAKLINKLSEIDHLWRIRYVTSHILDMDDDLIAEHRQNKKLQPFLHLPLQSGSDKILKAMNRGHNMKDYLKIIDKVTSARPDIALSSDFIVGFPQEDDDDFNQTLSAVKKIGYTACYSFCYSPRLGTPAAAMPQIPHDIKMARLQTLQSLLYQQEQSFNQATIGKTIDILVEKSTNRYQAKHPLGQTCQLMGRSPWLQPVHFDGDMSMIGKMIAVKINHSEKHSLFGELINSHEYAAA
ncbi:MAG: tRNA (N6-isopentenyl adenosine(37)-C2)-methylthiotransferase MiaB [Alphaproteobacteria bacterium]